MDEQRWIQTDEALNIIKKVDLTSDLSTLIEQITDSIEEAFIAGQKHYKPLIEGKEYFVDRVDADHIKLIRSD